MHAAEAGQLPRRSRHDHSARDQDIPSDALRQHAGSPGQQHAGGSLHARWQRTGAKRADPLVDLAVGDVLGVVRRRLLAPDQYTARRHAPLQVIAITGRGLLAGRNAWHPDAATPRGWVMTSRDVHRRPLRRRSDHDSGVRGNHQSRTTTQQEATQGARDNSHAHFHPQRFTTFGCGVAWFRHLILAQLASCCTPSLRAEREIDALMHRGDAPRAETPGQWIDTPGSPGEDADA